MKMRLKQYQKWFFFAACAIAVIVGGIYHFGIQQAFIPQPEDLAGTQYWYLVLTHREKFVHSNIIADAIMYVSVLLGGMSYFSQRLAITLRYGIILALSLCLSLTQKKGKERWYLLPLWAFFMIFIHTISSPSSYGIIYDPSGLVIQLPYTYHNLPLIFALISMVVLQCFLCAAGKKQKFVLGGIGIVVVIYALLYTDLIYSTIFVAPLLIVLILKGFYNDKARRYMLPLLALGVGLMLLTRILPGDFFAWMWSKTAVSTYGGAIYGQNNWVSLYRLPEYIADYFETIGELFNIDFGGRPIISFYSVLLVVRIAFVVIGYMIIVKIIKNSVKGKARQKGYNMVDEVLAWGFVVLSFAFVGSYGGHESSPRFFAALVPILTILLCRNIESFMREFLPVLELIKYKKLFFGGIVGALCICQIEPVWSYQMVDNYREDCEAAIEYLRQWGVEDDGWAVAPYWLYPRLSAMTNGEIMFYCDEGQVKRIYGEDAEIRYMVVGWENNLVKQGLERFAYGSYEEMCEKYKTPIRAVDLDYVFVCDFGE